MVIYQSEGLWYTYSLHVQVSLNPQLLLEALPPVCEGVRVVLAPDEHWMVASAASV